MRPDVRCFWGVVPIGKVRSARDKSHHRLCDFDPRIFFPPFDLFLLLLPTISLSNIRRQIIAAINSVKSISHYKSIEIVFVRPSVKFSKLVLIRRTHTVSCGYREKNIHRMCEKFPLNKNDGSQLDKSLLKNLRR